MISMCHLAAPVSMREKAVVPFVSTLVRFDGHFPQLPPRDTRSDTYIYKVLAEPTGTIATDLPLKGCLREHVRQFGH
jgi:hypothetical protein